MNGRRRAGSCVAGMGFGAAIPMKLFGRGDILGRLFVQLGQQSQTIKIPSIRATLGPRKKPSSGSISDFSSRIDSSRLVSIRVYSRFIILAPKPSNSGSRRVWAFEFYAMSIINILQVSLPTKQTGKLALQRRIKNRFVCLSLSMITDVPSRIIIINNCAVFKTSSSSHGVAESY